MVTKLEGSINCLVEVFHRYSLADGHYHTISKPSFKKLVETECPDLLKNPKGPKTMEGLLKELDSNQDEMVNFEEFLVLVTKAAVDAHDASHQE
ncbi:protein S100-A8-like [Macrotis lagotis]|uniref:protein S100-A8-like n=1 Tax=Macrotis lagotis TaxID=92651 RepID=UPI003D69AA46